MELTTEIIVSCDYFSYTCLISLQPLIVLILLFRCGGKVHLQCREQKLVIYKFSFTACALQDSRWVHSLELDLNNILLSCTSLCIKLDGRTFLQGSHFNFLTLEYISDPVLFQFYTQHKYIWIAYLISIIFCLYSVYSIA